MAIDKQINANRLNGKKGSPNTPAGRAAVRNNALKHGLSAHHPVISGLEKQSDFNKYLDRLRDEVQPAGIMEQMLVDQIADAYWRRQRIIQMETGMFDINNGELAKYFEETFDSLTPGDTLHAVAEYDAQRVDMPGPYYRYDARFGRSFFKAWKELKSLQAARPAEPEVVDTKNQRQTETNSQTNRNQARTTGPNPNPNPEPPEKAENDDSTM